ncbi:unnamed protein product, partial [Allacma fusca]
TNLKTLSDSESKSPFIRWRVKWVELSSMATHIHRLYNKRVRDMMNDEPYIKTVAISIQKYMGYPWYSKLSGNIDDNYRFLMKHFPEWIETRTESVPEGDLFYGLRRLLDENPTAKASSSVESGDCKGHQTVGRIVPASLEGPIYVLIYLALVDIKYFILINFYYIYLWVYESSPFMQQQDLEIEMKDRLAKKIGLYKEAFKDFGKQQINMPAPVEPGYFRCDPPQISPDDSSRDHQYLKSYIKITNFLKVFVAPEKNFKASKSCQGTCDMIDGTRAPCNPTDIDCIAEFEDDCAKNPETCAGFQPPCPPEDTICINSGLDVSYCKSTRPDRILEWTQLDGKTMGEYDPKNTTCSEPVVTLKGDWEMENDPVADTPTMCEICMCHCYSPIGDDMTSVRYFSLKPAVSSIASNKIVVGIKFQQIEDQIHLMVAEAKAMPKRQVDMASLVWRKPRLADMHGDLPQAIAVKRNLRIFHLDDIVAPPNHVVTGVRFIASSYEGVYLHEYIGIQIQVYQINEATGKIMARTGKWIGNQNATISREPYNYVDPDDPIKADGAALPDSSSNQFVTFRGTSIGKDLSQSTIPYFDAQRIILDKEHSGWLRGIGVFHKSRPRFGGFLGLKIIKYDEK